MSIGGFTYSPDPRYKFIRSLGSGSYGAVAAFRDNETGKDVAMKRIAQVLDDFLVCRRTLREVKVMRHFSHPNLLHLVDVLPVEVEKSQVFVVTPLMDWDLDMMIRKKGVRLSATEVCNFLVQMLLGLLHLHSGHVIHRDLKPANIFVRKDGLVKIGDLGLSRGIDLEDESGEPLRPAEEALTEYVVTRWYRAPEVILLPAEYGPPVDIWSVGCILYEMVTGKVLFQGRSSFDQLRRILAVLGTPKGRAADWLRQAGAAKRMLQQLPDSPPRLQKLREDWHVKMVDTIKSLLEEMLAFDPETRPSLEDALDRPCFADALRDRGVAEAKAVSVFQQEYDKEFDALDRASERRLLPKVVKMLQTEIHDFRGDAPPSRRHVTPPRSSSSASMAARRTPPRTAPNDNRRVTRASSGPRLSVPDADHRTEPRATSGDTKREARASSGPRVSVHDVDTWKESRATSGHRLSVPDGDTRTIARSTSGQRHSLPEGDTRTIARSTSGQRHSLPEGETRMAARSTSGQRHSLPEGRAQPLSARSSRSGIGSKGSDRALDPVEDHPTIDMAAMQRQSSSKLSTNPMSAKRKGPRGAASDVKELYSWAHAEFDDDNPEEVESSAPPCGPPPLSDRFRPSSAPRFSARGMAAKANAPFSAAARGEKIEGFESRSRVSSAPRLGIAHNEDTVQDTAFRGVEAWAAVPEDGKRDALLAARAEAARRERERAENRKQAEDTRVQEPERFLREVGLEMQQRQRRRASGSDITAGKDVSIVGLRAARDEAVRRELQRKTVAVPMKSGSATRGGGAEDEEVMTRFLKGLRQQT